MDATPRIRPVTPVTRIIFIGAAILAGIAGIQTYVLTDRTDHFFAWTIAAPLSATFLGTGYWAGALLLLFAAREQWWATIRLPLAAVGAFVPLMLLTTALHLDKFHLSGDDLNAVIAGWAWLVVYVAVPFALALVLWVQLRAPGGDPPPGPTIPGPLRVLILVNAAASFVLGLALFLAPDRMNEVWPWPLTPLTSQAIGTGFLTVTAASAWFLRENSLGRARGGTIAYLVVGALQLLALARYPNTVAWDRPATWLYVAFMAAILVGGLTSAVRAWRPGRVGRTAAADATR
jgi:hypothetical protein